jgi:hypothetical protein
MLIEQLNKDNTLSQISQKMNTTFSFAHYFPAEEKVVRLHEFIRCRDYLGDVLHACKYGKTHKIYGFESSPTRTPIDTTQTILLMKHQDEDSFVNFQKNIAEVVRKFEDQEGLAATTTINFTEEGTHYSLVLGDVRWQESIPMISLYTLLLRCACYFYKDVNNWFDELKEIGGNDTNYMNSISAKLFKFRTKLLSKLTGQGLSGWPDEAEQLISRTHNSSGILNVLGYSFPDNAYCAGVA